MSTATISYNTPDVTQTRKFPIAKLFGFGLLVSTILLAETNLRGGGAEVGTVDLSLLARLGVVALYGFFGWFSISHTTGLYLKTSTIWLAMFAVWALATLPFTINMIYTAPAVVALWCALLFVPALILKIGKRNFVLTIIVVLLCHLAISWIVELFLPHLVYVRESESFVDHGGFRLSGLNHPNAIGAMAAVALVLTTVAWHHQWLSRKWVISFGIFAGVSLLASDSRTAILATIAAMSTALWPRLNKALIAGVVIVALLFGIVWALGMEVDIREAMSGASRTGHSSEITELNGRTMLWPLVVTEIQKSPFVGYGYGCQRIVITSLNVSWAKYHAHNLFLQIMIGGGVVAGVLLGCIFYSAAVQWVYRPNAFADSIMVLLFVGGLANAVAFSPIPDTNTLLLIAAVLWRLLPDEENKEIARLQRETT